MKLRWPYLEFWFNCWLITVATNIMHERVECDHFEFVYLSIRFIGGRYGFKFRLYAPGHWRIS